MDASASVSFLIGGWSGLFVGFFGSTVLLWHATFSVNSFAHVFGRRRYETNDTSRNSLGVALLTGGEGWHNNHHHYPKSARQGFYWWEIDVTYGVLRMLAWVGLVHDLDERPCTRVAREGLLHQVDPLVLVGRRGGRRRGSAMSPVQFGASSQAQSARLTPTPLKSTWLTNTL